MWSKWESKGESCHRCVDFKETKLLCGCWKMSEHSRHLEQKRRRDYGTAGVLATSQNEEAQAKEGKVTSSEHDEWELADKERKNPVG